MADDAPVSLGRIGRPHGVQGEVRVWPHSVATASLAVGRTLHIGRSPTATRAYVIDRLRRDAKGTIVRFADCPDRESVEPLNGAEWFARRADFAPLRRDEVYVADLVGLAVSTVEGDPVGVIVDVLQVGPADLLVIRQGAREHLVPNVAPFVERLDPSAGIAVLRPIPGLLGD